MSDSETEIPYALQRNPETNKLNGASKKNMSKWRDRAIKYRRMRMELKNRLKDDLSIADFLEGWETYSEEEQKAYGNFKMIDIVTTMYYVGKKRGLKILEESKITPKRRLKALISNKTQRERFIKVIQPK